ncbi:hypothetical protein Vch1786_II0640 [Vibrio cholerae O1 str. 2010EL-1786]|nr:hypothetical protein VCD_000382 [Vibrio cholerae MJ-1236]AET29058.1 hypothetical protein Vch1786_II0640 [Vibrio cholerae O1 str. 2010EL-1786]EEO10641.1 hypothetical protein VCC_001655 [Vibrio cholerae RC9]EEO17623.1 hypothetical protein VCE_001642 [Vibrio cholerae B33]EEO21177.1 hypothetical protein VCF_001118 [Vibrio cholerae BX 330286]
MNHQRIEELDMCLHTFAVNTTTASSKQKIAQ